MLDDMKPLNLKDATLSDCGLYRYSLSRSWGFEPWVGFLMLNPSTADASLDDPTIRRCIGFAKAWGYGGLMVVNLFALRATDPEDLRDSAEAGIHVVGSKNDQHILECYTKVDRMVAAWGAHPFARKRAEEVIKLLNGSLCCLRLTKGGHPAHPLYLPGNLEPLMWQNKAQEGKQ